MLWPCAPCGWPQPRMTSSICWVELRRLAEHVLDAVRGQIVRARQVERAAMRLASGVRELATMTASLIAYHYSGWSGGQVEGWLTPAPPVAAGRPALGNLDRSSKSACVNDRLRSIARPHAQDHAQTRRACRIELAGHIRDEQEPIGRAAEPQRRSAGSCRAPSSRPRRCRRTAR